MKKNDRVESIVNGEKIGAQGTVILVCSNRNIVVEADDNAGTYIYDSNGDSIDMPGFSVKKVNNGLN